MPNKLFNWVVESKFGLDIFFRGNTIVVLNLFDKVFVADLSESTSLVGVKENVITPYLGANVCVKCAKFNIKFDFMVLKCNKWKR